MEKQILFSLRQVILMVGRTIENKFRDVGIDQATFQNSWFLSYIMEHSKNGENVYQKDLEKHFGITRSSVSKVINLMITKELLVKEGVDTDARLKKLVVTEKGKALLELSEGPKAATEELAVGNFTEDELNELDRLLNKILVNLSTESKERETHD